MGRTSGTYKQKIALTALIKMKKNKGALIVSHSHGKAVAGRPGKGHWASKGVADCRIINYFWRTMSLRLQTKTKAGLRVMALLVFFVVLWLVLSLILIMVKTSDLGDRLNRRIDDLEKRIDALRRDAAHPEVPEELLSASLLERCRPIFSFGRSRKPRPLRRSPPNLRAAPSRSTSKAPSSFLDVG